MADINVIVLPDGTEYPVSDYYLPVAISNPTAGQVLKYDAENQVWYNGDDAEGSSVFYGTSAPTSQLGVDGNLYVKYTEGTGGASDTVDALYVKLDGTWCQISTGGGGGTSDYNDLTNKPQINSVELSGNKSLDDLGIQPSEISKTATGSIVTFSDGGDNIPVESFECEIVAQQESGTPTPDNPLTITGFSQADIPVSGKNLLNINTVRAGDYNGTNLNIRVSQNVDDRIVVHYGKTYSIKLNIINNVKNVAIALTDDNNTLVASTLTSPFTPTQAQDGLRLTLIWMGYVDDGSWTNITTDDVKATNTQVEVGSTATPYVPYTGTLYSIAFGQTIYGGKLVYANGKWSIEATHGIVDLGTLNWVYDNNEYFRFQSPLSNIKKPTSIEVPNCISDIFEIIDFVTWVSNKPNYNASIGNDGRMYLVDNDYTDATAFKTAMNNHYLVYELTTPTIIPITSSTRVKTISGDNNIFSNTGDSTLKYFTNDADGIEELINVSETSAENTTIDDTNLDYEAGNVQEAFEKITKSLTYAEYQALSEDEKNNGTIYFIEDVNGDGQNFQPVIYSEEEREIGVWTDGRPLYEKCYTINSQISLSANTWTQTSFAQGDKNKCVSVKIIDNTGACANNLACGFVSDNIALLSPRAVQFNEGSMLVIQYTKTTDAPGSGTWTPQGVPAVHHSTDEHVVGTWIDGSTIYEKTFIVNGLTGDVRGWTYFADLLGVDTVIEYNGSAHLSNGSNVELGYYIIVNWVNNTLEYYCKEFNTMTFDLKLTIRYTKTS